MLNVKASHVLENNQWKLLYGRGWDDHVINFYQACITIQPKNGYYQWKWILDKDFSIRSAASALKVTDAVVNWYKIVCVDIIFQDMQSYSG